MFFTKHIKSNPVLDKIAIYLINFLMMILQAIRPRYKSGSNIVIISLHRLGDSVFTINAIKKIQKHHKESIYLICFEETMPIYALALHKINYIQLSRNEFKYRIAVKSARQKINCLNPYIIYDFTGTATSVSLFFRASAKEIVGCNEPYYRFIYTKFVPLRKGPHITDIYLDAISPFITDRSVIHTEYENDVSGEFILIHPFAGYKSKEWGLKKYIQLAEYLNTINNCKIVIPAKELNQDIIKELNEKRIEIVETENTSSLINLIKRCSLFIGNDSGPIHIANLLGKPTFTIYGPTNPDFHKPLAGKNQYIIKQIKCSPRKNQKFCFTHGGLFCPSNECMATLNFDQVKLNIKAYIEELVKEQIIERNY